MIWVHSTSVPIFGFEALEERKFFYLSGKFLHFSLRWYYFKPSGLPALSWKYHQICLRTIVLTFTGHIIEKRDKLHLIHLQLRTGNTISWSAGKHRKPCISLLKEFWKKTQRDFWELQKDYPHTCIPQNRCTEMYYPGYSYANTYYHTHSALPSMHTYVCVSSLSHQVYKQMKHCMRQSCSLNS